MAKDLGHYALYREAASLRSEMQAELIMNAFAFIKASVVKGHKKESNYLRVNKLSMHKIEQDSSNHLLSKS